MMLTHQKAYALEDEMKKIVREANDLARSSIADARSRIEKLTAPHLQALDAHIERVRPESEADWKPESEFERVADVRRTLQNAAEQALGDLAHTGLTEREVSALRYSIQRQLNEERLAALEASMTRYRQILASPDAYEGARNMARAALSRAEDEYAELRANTPLF